MRWTPQGAAAAIQRQERCGCADPGGSARHGRLDNRRALRTGRGGFTLFEALLVIVLMAVAGTMFLVSVDSLGRSSPADELEGAFWRAMAQARELALSSRRTVELRWDEDGQAFVLAGGGRTTRVPVPETDQPEAGKCAAEFTVEVAANDFILVRGELITRRATPAVSVFPDGSCQAFAVDLARGDHKHRVVVDPWTGAEMLSSDEKKGGRL